MFLNLQRGIDIDQVGMTLLGTSATTTAGTPFDFVGNLLSAMASRITAPATSTSEAASTSATSTGATSTPSIADTFFGAIFSRIAQWFADAANGITDFFAKVGHFEEVYATKLCAGATCVTETQLQAMLASAGQSPGAAPSPSASSGSSSVPIASSSATLGSSTPPSITIAGNNPAHIHVGDTYQDLGATAEGSAGRDLGVKTFLNGALVSDIILDTSTTTTDTIDYVATDTNGLTSTTTRTVIVEAANSTPSVTRAPDAATIEATSPAQ